MSRSKKTPIIEAIFNERYDPSTGHVSNPVVSIADLRHYQPTGNVYAFFKDIVRKTARANDIWPASVLQRGYTGIQDVSKGSSFRFIRLKPGQTVAFTSADILIPKANTPHHRVESASLPLAARQLGRGDEPWLIQVAVRLRLIETHLTLFSPRTILTVDHLQMSVKLGKSEIDALFLGVEQVTANEQRELVICCEAKSIRDDIIEEQIIRQVQAIARQRTVTQDYILPIAMKATGKSEIFIVEFDVVAKADAAALESLVSISEAVYALIPPVPGIGK
jgi:hypothetical protein